MELRADTPHFNIRLDSTGNVLTILDGGNVGIGTTSPGAKLEVNSSSTLPIIRARYNATYYTDYDSNGIQFAGTGQNFNITDNGSSVLYLKSGGNVGIGTTAPSQKLHVSGGKVLVDVTSSVGTELILQNFAVDQFAADKNYHEINFITSSTSSETTGGYVRIKAGQEVSGNDNRSYLGFWTAPDDGAVSEKMRITSAGNVGIGTTSPLGKLQVNEYTVGSNGTQGVHGELSVFANSGDESLFLGVKNASYPDRGWAFNTVTYGVNSNLQIKEHGSTAVRMTIQSGGNVGIGTTSPTSLLHVENSSGDANVSIVSNNEQQSRLYLTTTTNEGVYLEADDGATTNFYIKEHATGTARLTINRITGSVGIGTTSPQAKFHAIGHTMFSGGAYQTGYNTQNGLVIDSSNVTSASGAYGAGIEFTRLGDSTVKKAGIAPIQETADSDSIGLSFHTARTTTTTDPTYEAMRLTHDSKVGIGESAPASRLEVKGTAMSQFRMQTAGGPSTTNDTSGNVGDMAYDDDHLYIKTVNGWGRVALDFAF